VLKHLGAKLMRHRTVVGQDVVIEALRTYLRSPRIRNVDRLINTARRCRVEKRIRPYLVPQETQQRRFL